MKIECEFIETHIHELPDDWYITDTGDLRADPRFRPVVYEYWNAQVRVIHVSVVPFCDMEALDYCTAVGGFGPGFDPIMVSKIVNIDGKRKAEMLPWRYDKETDEVYQPA